MRKMTAIVLTAVMLFSLLPFKCLAEESSLAERSKNQMLELAETKYPGWRVADITVWQPLQSAPYGASRSPSAQGFTVMPWAAAISMSARPSSSCFDGGTSCASGKFFRTFG